MWDEAVLNVSGSSGEWLCGTAVPAQEWPSVFSCPTHPGLSTGVQVMSQRPLPVLFIFLGKLGHTEREASVDFSAGSSPVNCRVEDAGLNFEKPPCVGPSPPFRSGVWVPLGSTCPSPKSNGLLPLWPEVLGYRMFPANGDGVWSRGREKLLSKTSFTPSAVCSLLIHCA